MSTTSCPNCQSQNTCRILYGMPFFDEKLQKELDANKVHLGGCEIAEGNPDRYCNDCGVDFNSKTLYSYPKS